MSDLDLNQDLVDRVAGKLESFYESLPDDERLVMDAVFDQAAAFPEVTGHAFKGLESPNPLPTRPNPELLKSPNPNPPGIGSPNLGQGIIFRVPGGRMSFIIG